MFLKIGFTKPGGGKDEESMRDEAARITDHMEMGEVDLFHIRKPDWTRDETAALISLIPEHLHDRLKIHDHFSLLRDFNLGGVHLNSRNLVPPSGAKSVSKSLHSLEELVASCGTCYDYVTLSPIFDSISKPCYKSPFPEDLSVLRPLLDGKNVVALGGVTPEKFPVLERAGFIGGAMMGGLD